MTHLVLPCPRTSTVFHVVLDTIPALLNDFTVLYTERGGDAWRMKSPMVFSRARYGYPASH
jgi:hypothetical protein